METKFRRRRKSLIERANTEVSFFDVMRDFFGVELPRVGTPYATYCPFGFEHPDGGLDKKFRSYPDSNSGYCFVMHGSLTPVKLIAVRKELSWRKAAEFLLDHYDLLRTKPYPERWAALEEAKRKADEHQLGETRDIVEALRLSLTRHPAYADAQYEQEFLDLYGKLLTKLDERVERNATEEEIREWFKKAKEILTMFLDHKE